MHLMARKIPEVRNIKLSELKPLATVQHQQEKIKQESDQAIERMKQGNPGFNCKRCGNWFQPNKNQWIFHNLCGDCFHLFDEQKMKGRKEYLAGKENIEYFEDSDLWVRANPEM